MNCDLISPIDATSLLSTMFPEENWGDMLEDHFNLYEGDGMIFLAKEEVTEFVVNHTKGEISPEHMRVFCLAFLVGLETERKRLLTDELDLMHSEPECVSAGLQVEAEVANLNQRYVVSGEMA